MDYYVGTTATLKAEFVNSSGALADPTAITLTITAPDGSVTTLNAGSLTRVSTGVYTYNLALNLAGLYACEFDGTGAVPADGIIYIPVVATTGNRIRTGPCADWCSIDDVRALGAYSSTTTLTDPQILRMIPVASKILYSRTARRFSGVCQAIVRPSRRPRGPLPFPWFNGWLSTWQTSWGWGSCYVPGFPFSSCQCEHPSEVTLGYYPVRQILEVRVDGSVVSPTAYRLDDHRQLTRIDGNAWPSCQDLTADSTSAVNTFQVKFLYGIDPPADGVLAAAVLAGELALANTNQTCRLPRRLVQLTRQGVTTQVFDPTSLMKDGLFGIFEIDSFIGTENPHGLTRRSSITSPDVRSPVRRAGW